MAFHLGFYYFPTDLRLHVGEKEVPAWNRWDGSMPEHFFKISKQYLVDDGFLAVTQTIYAAAANRAMFKPV